ncbi:MAG: conjugal transfer protein TraR [endosymbiont of Galathealinum brachiosum]|uniref:Conjugal transfer protein TraR n=1 Tax=endosymbiont of Galathealinum brachiosum TaxID=2200906 RepID=A0A370DJ82_9GAMM|nr:MAG: conjugal transfer protein TraR [endosymbiont of Galathealinum brachiosum]
MVESTEYKTQLVALRADLTQRVNAIDKDLHHENEAIEKDFAEQATQLENEEVLNSLNDEAKATVMQIDKALLRINDGRFGLCGECGIEINKQRLDAVPYAEFCIKCAE